MTKQNISKVLFSVTLFLFLTPAVTHGYYTTNQTAQTITQDSALYTIDFTFGFSQRDVYIPILTQQGLAFEDSTTKDTLGYSFTSGGTTDIQDGTATGLVLSSLPIENGMYKVAAGTRGHFKLVVIFTKDSTEAKRAYALQVDKLPFPVTYPDGQEDYFELKPIELERYISPEVII